MRAVDGLVNVVIVVVLVGLFAIGCYAVWDSGDVDARASAANWQPYKPTEPEPFSFWELQDLNPDVKAWLSVYGTGIDYPVCQSDDEWKYLSTNAKGEPSASGALFLGAAADPDFRGPVTFVYGHHMEHDVMFGQVTDFIEEGFFEEHQYGCLYAGGRNQGLRFFACLQADAYDQAVFRQSFADAADREAWLQGIMRRAVCARDVDVAPEDRIVALSTCSSEQTNGRTVLLGLVTEDVPDDPFSTWPNTGTGVDSAVGFGSVGWLGWLLAGAAVALALVAVALRRRAADGGARKERDEAQEG